MKKRYLLGLFLTQTFILFAQTDPCSMKPGIILSENRDSVAVNEMVTLRVQGCAGLPLWYLKDPGGAGAGNAVEMGETFKFRVPVDNKEQFIPIYVTCYTDSCTSPAGVFYLKTFDGSTSGNVITAVSDDRVVPTVPPSPNAASLGKYAEIPVSYYTGLPQTGIPIYTVQEQDITVPVSLSYHHGGIRVEEEASWVGLGWTLNAGGAITRTIRGGDDLNETWGYAFNVFPQDFVFGQANNPAVDAYYQKYRNYQVELDTQPDIFYYNIGGVAGKFVIEGKANNSFPLEGIPLDKSNVKIKCYKLSDKNYKWEIVTENGMVYTFAEQEVTATATSTTIVPQDHEKTGTYTGLNYSFSASTKQSSSWFLSTVRSARTTASVSFEYYDDKIYTSTSRLLFNELYKQLEAKCSVSTPNCSISCAPGIGTGIGSVLSSNLTAMQNKYLKAIVFENGRVEFGTEQREDIQPLINNDPTFPFADVFVQSYGEIITKFPVTVPFDGKPQRLNKITVKDKSSIIIKEWGFEYTYFNESLVNIDATDKVGRMEKYNNLRLRLNRTGEITTDGEIYGFTYEGDNTVPVVLPSKVSTQRDLFGYYNANTFNDDKQGLKSSGWYPKLGFNAADLANPSLNGFFFIDGAFRDVDSLQKIKGSLKMITYPTGGSRNFQYESHKAPGGKDDVDLKQYTSSFFLSDVTDTYFEISLIGDCSGPDNGGANPTCEQNPNDIVATFSNGSVTHIIRFQDLSVANCSNPTTGIKSCQYQYNVPFTQATPGNYTVTVNVSAFAMFVYTYRYRRSNDIIVQLGGLRVKSITTDDFNGNTSKQYFTYEEENGDPSGVQLTPLVKYSYGYTEQFAIQGNAVPTKCTNAAYGIILSAGSLAPLGSALGGNHVGYSRVVEKVTDVSDNGSNGYTVHEFLNEPLTGLKSYSYYVDAPQFPSYGNGMPTRRTVYSQDDKKVSETIYSPTKGKSTVTVKGLLISLGSTGQDRMFVNPFYYDVRSEFWYNPTVKQRAYTNGNYVETVERQVYDLSNDHFQLAEKWQTAPEAVEQANVYDLWHKTAYKYPYNFTGNAAMSALVGENRLGEVIEQQQEFIGWDGTNEVSSETLFEERYGYQSVNGTYLPGDREIKYENGTWQQLATYDNYDPYGNLTQYSTRSGETHYLNYFGLADSGKTHLLKSSEIGDGSTNGSFNPLQRQAFDYEPLRGIKIMARPNGLSNSYEYDNLSRLLRIRDNNADMTHKFDYSYANNNGCPAIAAPTVSVNTGTCNVTLTASGCSGIVNWSNGATGVDIVVPTGKPVVYTASCSSGICSSPPSQQVALPALPAGWDVANISNNTAVNCVQQLAPDSYSLYGSGIVDNLKDSLHFVHRSWSGNFTAIIKLSDISRTTGDRAGLMVRESLQPDAQVLTIYQDGNKFVGINRRATMGFLGFKEAVYDSTWVKMTRTGNDFRVYYSTDPNPEANGQWKEDFAWQNSGSNPTAITMGSTVYIGITAWGNNNSTALSNLSIY